MSFVDVTNGTFLGSTGRTVMCFPAVLGSNSVTFSCDTVGIQAGPNGSGILAQLNFSTLAAGTSGLLLDNVLLTDTLAAPQSANTSDGTITVVLATPTPTPTP